MSINKKQLEINVNLHCLTPNFVNLELRYVIAKDENTFRFVEWNEEPNEGETKFYCFLTEDELYIPAGDFTLEQSYALKEEAVYPVIESAEDFIKMIKELPKYGVAKGVRRFKTEDIDAIRDDLCKVFGDCEKHLVSSAENQHLLFALNNIDISISATMVYFRYRNQYIEPAHTELPEGQPVNI